LSGAGILLFFILFLLFSFVASAFSISAFPNGAEIGGNKNVVYVLRIEGEIYEGASSDILEGIKEAEETGAEAILIELDTPGGLVASMLEISKAILNSKVPVITYVTPKGAIAASAGSFILVSGNIAAMTPGTTTGAAMPVSITGEKTDNKTINFLAGHMESVAASRGRNATQAMRFVTENDVLNERTALEVGIIDLIAEDEKDLLNKIDGMTVKIGTENKTLATKNASLYLKEKGIRSKTLEVLSNPQIAVILLMVGMYGLIFGFMSPGTYVPETIGAICLILSLYGLGLFDVNIFGVILIILAVILFIAEALTPTFGILTACGVACLIIGALILPKEPLLFNPQWFKGFLLTIVGIAVASTTFFLFAMGAVLKSRKKRPKVGAEELIGEITKAETEISEEGGTVKIRGELWNARTIEGGEKIKKGEKVKIVSLEGLTLIVEAKAKVEEEKKEEK
jgi:membrane-bound serine protease (ClpP class)